VSQPANTELRTFRDAVYHRHMVDPAQQLPAAALVEARALRYGDFRAADPAGSQDGDLIRHWAVADLIAVRDAAGGGERDRIKRAILVNTINHPRYAATVAEHSPELLRGELGVPQSASTGEGGSTSAIDGKLAALGYQMEASLSALDSEDDGHALLDLVTQELVDPPNDEVRALVEAWTAEQDSIAAPHRAMKMISDNHVRLLRSIDAGVVPKEELHALAAEDAAALRSLSSRQQRAAAATSMAQSAGAHPGYAHGLVEIDELIAREVAAADEARRRTEAEFLLVQVERRRELIDGADAAGLTAAAHADSEAFMRIGSDEERLLALIVIGHRAQKLSGYAGALADVNRELAEEAAAARAQVQAAFRGAAGKPHGDAEPELVAANETTISAAHQEPVPAIERHPLFKDLNERGSRVLAGEMEPSALAETVRMDVEAVLRIPSEEESARALESIGWTSSFHPAYEAVLKQHSPHVARLAKELQGIALDTAYGDSRSADFAVERGAIITGLRAIRGQVAPASSPQAVDVPSAGPPLASDQASAAGDAQVLPDAEASAIEAIRARHAARREAGAPIEAVDSTEIGRLALADASDLAAVTSPDGLRTVAAEMADCLTSADYVGALESADLRSAAALRHLHFQLMMLKAQREREAEAARRRGIFGVIAEEGEAPEPRDDAQRQTYFVRYVEDSGRVGVVWGRHLPAALRQSGAAVGDRVQIVRGPTDPAAAAEDLACDKSRFTVQVLERSQLVDDDADTASASVSNAPVNNAAPAPEPAEASDSRALSPGPAIASPAAPAPALAPVQPPPAIDARTLQQLAAKRARETASVRTAAGLAQDDAVAAAPAQAAPLPQQPAGPTGQTGAAPATIPSKASSPAPAPKGRPANPLANGVTGDPADARPIPSEAIAKLLESVSYEVKGNGSVLYLVRGRAAFVDHGQQILMHDAGNEEDDALLAAVLLAKEKWGKVELTGTQAFKQRALELLVKHNIDVTLKNAEQDAMRRQLMAAAPPPAATSTTQEARIGKPRQETPAATPAPAPPAAATSAAAPTPTTSAGGSTLAPAQAAPAVATAAAAAVPVLAKDLAPIRARDWWTTQRSAIAYWSKGKPSADMQADLAKLGPEPSPEQVFWFEQGGRRCDPPADAKAFEDSLAAADANLKEINMANPKGKSDDPPVLLRGVVKNGDEFKTTALLFQGKGDYLQGFIVANGEKHQVIVHINQRKPDGDGVVRPNFLKVSERVGNGENALWKEIGFGNAVNHRSDGKVVHFDEVLFNIGQEVVKARVTAKVDADMHRNLGFLEARKSRDAAPAAAPQEPVRAKESPAAHAREDVAAEGAAATRSRRSPKSRAAA
jgi:Large polyvalent protein-associated domain 7